MTLFQRSRTVINQQQQISINIRFFQSSTSGKVRKNRDKQSLRQGSSPEAFCICTYQKTKRKYFVNGLSQAILENSICFFASRFYKTAADSSYFRKKMLYLQMKELFDSIATQNAEIRTVANSLPPLFK